MRGSRLILSKYCFRINPTVWTIKSKSHNFSWVSFLKRTLNKRSQGETMRARNCNIELSKINQSINRYCWSKGGWRRVMQYRAVMLLKNFWLINFILRECDIFFYSMNSKVTARTTVWSWYNRSSTSCLLAELSWKRRSSSGSRLSSLLEAACISANLLLIGLWW